MNIIKTLSKALRTQALTALTSSFGLVEVWFSLLGRLGLIWFGRFGSVGLDW